MATYYPLHHIAFIHAFTQKLSAFFALNSNPFFAKPTANLSPSLPPFIALLAGALRTSQAFIIVLLNLIRYLLILAGIRITKVCRKMTR